MAANDQINEASDVRTERLANQAQPASTLVSQQGSAQAERVEIVQIIGTSGVSSITGTANQVTVSGGTGAVVISLPASITVTTEYRVGGTKIIKSPKTGWTQPSGTATRTGFDTTTATTQELAEALKALIDDLHVSGGWHGLIKS